jgi:outer membrane protein TolC
MYGCQETGVEPLPILDKLPPLEQIWEVSSRARNSSEASDVELEVKRNYDLILARREQLEVSKEVQGHFEKAVTQAEKKFEEGEDDISQSAITKLKLGLAGTLNDISKFNSDIALAQLRLGKYLGVQWAQKVDISAPKLQPEDFSYRTVDDFLASNPQGAKAPKGSKLFDLEEALIEINKAREQLALAGKNRKMTRALLVAEAANYDFGIVNEADLFEALIIYTRVSVGYYEAIHIFNISFYRISHLYNSR